MTPVRTVTARLKRRIRRSGALPSQRGKRKTFDQELADDARTSGAHGQTNGDFLDAAGAADEQEVGQVGAGNQQDGAGGGHQDPKRSGELATGIRTALRTGQNVDPTF